MHNAAWNEQVDERGYTIYNKLMCILQRVLYVVYNIVFPRPIRDRNNELITVRNVL